MKNQEKIPNIKDKEKFRNNPLALAYLEIYEKEPEGLEDWQIAEKIVEVLDNPNFVSQDLAKDCIFQIVHQITYPNEERRINIILMAEKKARHIFPELSNIDEVHMDQIEYVYKKWLEKNKNINKS